MPLQKTFRRMAPMALVLLMGAADADGGPRYTPAGDFLPPVDYREWVYMSSGLDMSYSDQAPMMDHSMFDNVFVDPAAWAGFKRTGHWPDKSMFALEIRGANSKGSINQHGQYQTTQLMGVEYHVRDEARFKGGWGFFAAVGQDPAKLIPYEAPCYSCHQSHAAVDTTFTQFYPTAKAIAVAKGTYQDR